MAELGYSMLAHALSQVHDVVKIEETISERDGKIWWEELNGLTRRHVPSSGTCQSLATIDHCQTLLQEIYPLQRDEDYFLTEIQDARIESVVFGTCSNLSWRRLAATCEALLELSPMLLRVSDQGRLFPLRTQSSPGFLAIISDALQLNRYMPTQ